MTREQELHGALLAAVDDARKAVDDAEHGGTPLSDHNRTVLAGDFWRAFAAALTG
jgi:hypothetical protein